MLYQHPLYYYFEPHATIRVFRSTEGYGPYILTGYANELPEINVAYDEHNIERDINRIVSNMNNIGWDCERSLDKAGFPMIYLTHRATQKAINNLDESGKRNLKEYLDRFKNSKKGYIRFGLPPKSGYSKNHKTNELEKGVCVYEADIVDGDYRLIVNRQSANTFQQLLWKNRSVYRLKGIVVGMGGDGEPVLEVTKKILLIKNLY